MGSLVISRSSFRADSGVVAFDGNNWEKVRKAAVLGFKGGSVHLGTLHELYCY
jgi:hypothetical protein